jgi:chorismate mutase
MLGLTRIKKLQHQVDDIDSRIAQLLLQRFELSHEIMSIRQQESLGVTDPARDQIVIERIGAIKGTPETQLALMRIFRAVIDWGVQCYQSKPAKQDEFLH